MTRLKQKEDFIPFDKLNITTSVISAKFKSPIDFMILFLSYPCSPFSNKRGSVNYMRCKNHSRGVNHKVDKNTKYFKNSTMMVIKVDEDKIINMKVFEKSFHISGSKTLEDTEKCLNTVMKNIHKIKKQLTRMKSDMKNTKIALDWFIESIKGNPYIISRKNYLYNTKYFYRENIIDYEIKKKKLNKIVIPPSIDKKTIKFFLGCTKDLILSKEKKFYISNIKNRLEHLINIDVDLYDNKGPLLYTPLKFHMINLNTDLGFLPDRAAFRDVFTSYGICASYINALASHTKIQIAIDDPKYLCESKQKKKKSRCTIMVHRTGKVTHSSPHSHYLEMAYNKFSKIVFDNKKRLMLKI
jgi:hypothetical protein